MRKPNLLSQMSAADEEVEEGPIPEPLPRRRWWPWIVLVFVLILGIFTIPLLWHGWQLASQARQTKHSLDVMKERLLAVDIDGAQVALEDARLHVDEIKVELRGLGNWRYVPWLGTQIRALEDLQRSGELALDGAARLLEVAATMKEALASMGVLQETSSGIGAQRSFQDLSRDEKQQILRRLYGLLPDLRLAKDKIVLAEQAWAQIPQNDLAGPLRTALAPIAENLPKFKQQIEQSVSLMEVMIPLMGYPQEKQYLVLLQNSDELRPTGGFIGNIGVLKVDGADIEEIQFIDVYALDNLVIGKLQDVPPEILRRELNQTAWYLRDSNWSPDYVQSASRIMDVYQRSRQLAGLPAQKIDGVIALQPAFFQALLRLTGPLQVEDKRFTADNFFDIIQYDVEMAFHQEGRPTSQRKEIVGKVGEVLVNTLMHQPASKWSDLLSVATDSLEKKNILLSVTDPSLQALVDAKDWSGRVHGSEGDFLWVIDANLAALKTDGVLQKDIYYTLDLSQPTQPMATVRLVYENVRQSAADFWRYTRYRSYTRVYVPEGSTLISSKGAMLTDKSKAGGRIIPGTVDTFKDLGKTGFGAFWAIEPGETGELSFTYQLPPSAIQSLTEQMYRLYVQKQPGADVRVHTTINFYRPVTSATPGEDPKKFGDNRYEVDLNLEKDQKIEVRLK